MQHHEVLDYQLIPFSRASIFRKGKERTTFPTTGTLEDEVGSSVKDVPMSSSVAVLRQIEH